MRLSVRLNLSLVAGVTLVSMGIALYETQSETSGLRRDLERQAALLAESLEKSAAPLMAPVSPEPLQVLVNAFQNRQRLAGVAIYNAQAQPIAASSGLAARLGESPHAYLHSRFFRSHGQLMHVYALPIAVNGAPAGTLAIFHDAAYIESRQRALWKNALTGLAMQAALIICVTLLILQCSLRRPLKRLTQWMGDVRRARRTSPIHCVRRFRGRRKLHCRISRVTQMISAACMASPVSAFFQSARCRDSI